MGLVQPLSRGVLSTLLVVGVIAMSCSDKSTEPGVITPAAGQGSNPGVGGRPGTGGAFFNKGGTASGGGVNLGGVGSGPKGGSSGGGGQPLGLTGGVPGSGSNNSGGVGSKSGGAGGKSGGAGGAGGLGGSGGRVGGAGGRSGGAGGTTGPGDIEPPPPITNGCNGWASRYWDCCKPHCSWAANAPNNKPAPTCGKDNNPVGADTASACGGGNGYQCGSMVPWSVGARLSYGYAAVHTNDMSGGCGRCYQIDFTGGSAHGNAASCAPLKGKTMIVQTVNVGSDVSAGQFDLLIPGGGVGINANTCPAQWGANANDLGPTAGGFRAACASDSNPKACVLAKCKSVFADKGLTDMAAGCNWYANWFEAADNPDFVYKEVACPAALSNKSNMTRSDIKTSC